MEDGTAMKELIQLLIEQNRLLSQKVLSQGNANRTLSEPELVSSLSERILMFNFDRENGKTFQKWIDRFGEIITVEGKDLSEETQMRLLLSKLDEDAYERFANEVKPGKPSEVKFSVAVETLKRLFDVKISLVTERHKCMNLTKFDSEDIGMYTSRVHDQCERAKLTQLKPEDLKAYFWIFGLKSPRDGDIRTRLLALMEKRQDDCSRDSTKSQMTIGDLRQEYDKIVSFRADSKLIERPPGTVISKVFKGNNLQRTNFKMEDNTNRCFKCDKPGHVSRRCTVIVKCARCGKPHLDKYCEGIRNFIKNKRANSVRAPTLDSPQVLGLRKYVNVHISGRDLSFQLDTGADVTLMSVHDWVTLGKPELRESDTQVRSASGNDIKIKGILQCNFILKGKSGSGTAHSS